MNIKLKHSILYICLCTFFVGCASIPPEAPELSAELGNRISAIEDANLVLLHRFFDRKREDVDRFIMEEWMPGFAKEIFSSPRIADDWNTIVSENNKEERLKFIVNMGPKLQEKINSKRLEMIKPLDDLEKRIEQEIRNEYSRAMAMNNSITSFLLSASKVAENRKRYLEMAGFTDARIGKLIDSTDEAVTKLLEKTADAQDKIEAAKKYMEKIKSIKDSIK